MDLNTLRAFRADSRTVVRELGFLRDGWAPAGLTTAQVHLLLELAQAGQMRPSELAERLRSDPAVVSRSTKDLAAKGLIDTTPDPSDGRQRQHRLTQAGMAVVGGIHDDADSQVRNAFGALEPTAVADVLKGMQAYAKALRRARLQSELVIREIRANDDPAVTALIRTVMPEFGANGPGFAIMDPEVEGMSAAYSAPRSNYFVVERRGEVLGGGGYAPLIEGDGATCELRKMYFRTELRGLGMGAKLLTHVLEAATAEGFKTCYLETLEHMTRARRLYKAFGFKPLEGPRGQTGHHGCDAWYERPLSN